MVCLQRAQSIAVLLLWIAGGLGTALAALLGALCCCRLPWGVQLASDPEVLVLVRKVAPQSMVSQFLCAVVLTLEGIAIGSGEQPCLPLYATYAMLQAVQCWQAMLRFLCANVSHPLLPSVTEACLALLRVYWVAG